MALPRKRKSLVEAEDQIKAPIMEQVSETAIPVLEEPETPLQKVANSIHSFEASMGDDKYTPFSISALGLALETVIKAVAKGGIPEYALINLLDVLPTQSETQEFNSDFDLGQEITNQLRSLKSIENDIFSSDNRIKSTSSVKEAKDFMASKSSMIQMLQKSKAELLNMERLQAVEEATIETLKDLDEELKEKFLETLNDRLKLIV